MYSGLLYVLAVFFGLAVGSFLNAFIWRLKNNKSIRAGRSICPNCGHVLAWIDLIPVFSYVFLRGRCRYCAKKISWQYPTVELATAILFALVMANCILSASASSLLIIRDWFFISILIIIFVYDLRWGFILDRVTLPAAVIAFSVNIVLGMNWQSLLLAATIGSGFFAFQYLISKGRWVGGGDLRLGALMGFMLGWPDILAALFIAYFIGAIIAIYLLVSGRKKIGSEIAMGTFLSAATIITLLWGDIIIKWYFGA